MTKQQESIILKGIAQNLLQMNVPSFNEANNLFNQFGYQLVKVEPKQVGWTPIKEIDIYQLDKES